jgi:hypothetical protein
MSHDNDLMNLPGTKKTVLHLAQLLLQAPGGPHWHHGFELLRPSPLVGGIPTPLKNDGVRQLGRIIPYMKWKIKFMSETTNHHCVMLIGVK